MNNISGKPCGCGDFDFCIVCADSIERKEIIAQELRDMLSTLNPQAVDPEEFSREMHFSPEKVEEINRAGELQDRLEAYRDAAYTYLLDWQKAYRGVWHKDPTPAEYRDIFDWPLTYPGMDYRGGLD